MALPASGPLSMADIPWQLRKQQSAGLSGNLLTLEDGRADFLVTSLIQDYGPSKAPPPPDGLPVVLMLRETLAPDLVLGAEKALGALQRGERRDLGTIAMAPLPLLCEGRVVDDRGEPRANAAVISPKIVATIASISPWRKCGLLAANCAISSDLVMPGFLPKRSS